MVYTEAHIPADRSHPATSHCREFFPGEDETDWNTEGSTRLNYVFVEKPKPRHDVTVDIARMWRMPFSTDCPFHDLTEADAEVCDDCAGEGRLVDHAGIGFELLVTPKQ